MARLLTLGQAFAGCHESILLQFLEDPSRAPDDSCIAGMPELNFEMKDLDLQRFLIRISSSGQASNPFIGSWQAVVPGTRTVTTIDLKVDGGNIRGQITNPRATVDIFEGRLTSDTVTFEATSPDGARTITLTGIANGDEVDFVRDLEERPGGNPRAQTSQDIFGIRGPKTFTARRLD